MKLSVKLVGVKYFLQCLSGLEEYISFTEETEELRSYRPSVGQWLLGHSDIFVKSSWFSVGNIMKHQNLSVLQHFLLKKLLYII